MKIRLSLSTLVLTSVLFISCQTDRESGNIEQIEAFTEISQVAPMAEKRAYEHREHGNVRQDPWFWLREREDPDVIAYLEAENAYTDAQMADTGALQDSLYEEMIARLKQDDASVPYFLNGYYYYSRYEEGREYPVYARKKGSLDAPEEILLDVNELAEGYSFYNVSGLTVSEDNKLLAFGEDTLSRRKYTIRIKDLSSGEFLPDQIDNTTGRSAWASDNKTLFFDRKDETLRPFEIYRYSLGDRNSETLVYREPEDTYYAYVYKTKSRDFIVIGSGSTLSSEYRVIPADDPYSEPQIIHPREEDMLYYIDHYGNDFYIMTNDEAQNFRLMKTPVTAPGKANWTEVIAHRPEVLLEGFEIFSDYFVLNERSKGMSALRIISWDGEKDYYLPFEEEAFTINFGDNPEFDTGLLRYEYTSMTTPTTVYDFNMVTKENTLLKQDEVLGGYDPADYETKRIFAPAADGTSIPMSLVYRKDLDPKDDNPLLLYGYGSYGITIDPSFRSYRLSLLDRGFVYVIAHIRGGQMMGRQWYEDGKLFNKMNTFTDFIDCGSYLVSEGYTSNNKMFAMGGSAGGLLIGAVINMEPQLFNGVIAAVPFVDVVTTMLDESIPLTTGEYDEWGNPNELDDYEYMLSYSPYDRVKAVDYPNILITTGLHDSQVQYWEPAKWTAKLRDMKTDSNLLLLKTDMETGHGGASGRFKRYQEIAFDYAFILKLLKKSHF